MCILKFTYQIIGRVRLQLIFPLIFLPFLMNAQSWQELHKKGKKAYQEGKYEEAHENFISAQRQAPENVDLSKDIGTAAYRMGDYDSAEDIFTRKAQNDATSISERAKKWHNVGNSQMKQKNYAGAVESYKNALRLNPENQQTRYNYAEAKRRLTQQEENQDQDQDSDDSDSQNNQNDNQQNDNNQNDSQNDSQENNQQNQSQDQDESNNQENQRREAKNQRNIDKTLEELLKREMETKKKVKGYKKGEESESKSNKKW